MLNIPSSALVNEFLTKQGREVIKKVMFGFTSADAVTKFADIDENLILAHQKMVADLIYEYRGTTNFERTDNALIVEDVTLTTFDFKVELRSELNERKTKAYKAYLKGAGLAADDLHFVEWLNMAAMEKMKNEMEVAMWQAVTDTTVGNIGLRKLIARFDGFRKIAKDAGVASKATVVATGAITDANAVAKVHQFYRAASTEMKNMGFNIYCSYNLFESYQENYSATHGGRDSALAEVKRMQYSYQGIPITLGAGKTMLVPVPGFGDDDALIGTRPEYLAYGFNTEGEDANWKIQEQDWFTKMLTKFPVGVQILLKEPGFLLVNDQL